MARGWERWKASPSLTSLQFHISSNGFNWHYLDRAFAKPRLHGERCFQMDCSSSNSTLLSFARTLRRGGATWYFTKFSSLDRVMVMGRWQAARTARIYLNEGQAALADMHFTPQRVHLNPFHRTFLNTNPLKHQTLEPPRGSAGGRGKRSKRSKPQKKDKKRKPKKAKSHRK